MVLGNILILNTLEEISRYLFAYLDLLNHNISIFNLFNPLI